MHLLPVSCSSPLPGFPASILPFSSLRLAPDYAWLRWSSIKRSMPKYDEVHKRLAVNVAAGACAGAGSLVLVYPLDFARTRLAADLGKDGVNREFTGLYDCLASTVRRGGPLAIYRGFLTSLVMFSFYRGLYFGLYDTARDATKWDHPVLKWAIAVSTTAVAGLPVCEFIYLHAACICLLANMLLFFSRRLHPSELLTCCSSWAGHGADPLDTVRRTQMMEAGTRPGGGSGGGGGGGVTFRVAAGRIYSQAGLRGFYVGCVPNILRGMGGSVVLVLYDEMSKLYKTADE
jgi:solute carrier family 25 (adenine nucleotide translocator) protein 4/5/6/31